MPRRVSARHVVIFLALVVPGYLVYVTYLRDCYPHPSMVNQKGSVPTVQPHNQAENGDVEKKTKNDAHHEVQSSMSDVTCLVNRGVSHNVGLSILPDGAPVIRKYQCKRDTETDVLYVPFNIMQHYYEASGKYVPAMPNKRRGKLNRSKQVKDPNKPRPKRDVARQEDNWRDDAANNEVYQDESGPESDDSYPDPDVRGKVRPAEKVLQPVKNNVRKPQGSPPDNQEVFDISLSYSKVISLTGRYTSTGGFLQFAGSEVELRSRVLTVSASQGVPVTTQWDPDGYYYPTQIAQYGLSHYSSHVATLNKDIPIKKTSVLQMDSLPPGAISVKDTGSGGTMVEFKDGMKLQLSSPYLVLHLAFKSYEGASFQVTVEMENRQYQLIYSNAEKFIQVKDESTFEFGFGTSAQQEWLELVRDLGVDLVKGLAVRKNTRPLSKKAKQLRRNMDGSIRVVSIAFHGHGLVNNLTLGEDEHRRLFFFAADWFVANQDKDGGWPSFVSFNEGRRKYPEADEIPPGWYGAMCQGQAMSVLVRAFHLSKKDKYLRSAQAALGVFQKSSQAGGVRSVFLNLHPWYEEYPTNPPTFVLNGFMYSLMGLYDLSEALGSSNTTAFQLFSTGMQSLKALLPLYDAGSRTFYDLRHFTMKTAPKIARWDYHTVHINLLLALASIDNDRQLKNTAERWRAYMVGRPSPHN